MITKTEIKMLWTALRPGAMPNPEYESLVRCCEDILQRALEDTHETSTDEPVGYFGINNQGCVTTYEQCLDDDIDEHCIPLYRHPAPRRELSDAEIDGLFEMGMGPIEFARTVLEAAK